MASADASNQYGTAGNPIDIDNINSQIYLIRIMFNDTGFSGAAPSGLGGNSALLIGFSVQAYGVQIAIGFGSSKIAIRHKPFQSTWQAWSYK